MDLANIRHWEESYKNTVFHKASKSDQIRNLIEKYIPKGDGNAFEIGCYPGRYLSVFGDLGYRLNGVDLVPETSTLLKSWLKLQKYTVGSIEEKDYLFIDNNIKYDIVCSFGFIEHFKNYHKVIQSHCGLVDQSGYLVITTPNFSGSIQNFLRRKLDPVSLSRHNINSMKPDLWAKIAKDNNFDILYSGYFGYFYFWANVDNQNSIQKRCIKLVRKTLPITSRMLPNNLMSTAPFCGMIAKRK